MIEWKDNPNMVHGFMKNGVCGDITSSSDPVFLTMHGVITVMNIETYHRFMNLYVYIYIYIYHNIGYHILISFVLCMSNIYYD